MVSHTHSGGLFKSDCSQISNNGLVNLVTNVRSLWIKRLIRAAGYFIADCPQEDVLLSGTADSEAQGAPEHTSHQGNPWYDLILNIWCYLLRPTIG